MDCEDVVIPRDTATPSLLEWAKRTLRGYGQQPARHHRILIEQLETLCSGAVDRLMVQMPPGSAKSTYASMLFPVWWFTRHPRDSIIAASHTASLATYFGRHARGIVADEMQSLGYQIATGDRANSHWSTSKGGEYYAVGVRGAMIGRRADLAIIDDPIKSQSEADSARHRDRLWDWYRSELVPRLKPKARILLVMTRWHQDDLCGRLLMHAPGEWHCLRFPALAEEGDPLDRPLGEPLWPEWEDLDALMRRRATVGERAWFAQFQQNPHVNTGTFFVVKALAVIDTPPSASGGRIVRAWDLAATTANGSNDPDWTAGVKLMRQDSGRFVVLDVVRLRGSPREVEECLIATAKADGTGVAIGLPRDPGQAGQSQITYLTASLAGYRVHASPETGSKMTRATPVASQIEGINVALLRGGWNHAFIEELRDFPYGGKDDQVDALSRAFSMLLNVSAPVRGIVVPFISR
jgi:predicted phage terminase large subunit-like protein